MDRPYRIPPSRLPFIIFGIIFGIRVLGVLFTSITGSNPFAQADALTFASHAERTAEYVLVGDWESFSEINIRDTNQRMGLLLAVYWVLPGPSHLIARFASAFFGSLAIYNVYILARHFHSHRAGILAVAPLAVYPSIILVHSTVLREAMLLFAITMAVRIAIAPPLEMSNQTRITLVGVLLGAASFIRFYMFPIFIVTLLFWLGLLFARRGSIGRTLSGLVVLAGAGTISIPLIDRVVGSPFTAIESLSSRRLSAARGRTAYLPDVAAETVLEVIISSWILAAYFLYAPFLWMVESPADFVIWVETLVTIMFTVAALFGTRVAVGQRSIFASVLLFGLVVGVVAFSLGVANVGHATRLRQLFLWIIFLFGGVGIVSRFNFQTGSE